MKRIIAMIAALLFSLILTGCGSNNQASAIKAACDLANAQDFEATRDAFVEIAANDPGYITASVGAKYWAESKGEWSQISWIPDLVPIVYESVSQFFGVCNFN